MARELGALSDAFIERHARELYHCSSCNYCVDAVWPERGIDHVCPTMQQHSRAPGYSGRGFIEAARAVLEGVALDADGLGERVFTCTTCGNCESVCPIGLHPATIGHGLRQELAAAGVVPPAVAAAHERIVERGHPFDAPGAARAAWATGLTEDGTSEYTYFAGCAAAVALPDEARAGFALMARAGRTPALAATGDHCCGAPLGELGFEREAAAWSAGVRGKLQRAAGQRVVVAGYECGHRFAAADTLSLPAWLFGEYAAGRLAIELKRDMARPLAVHAVESCQLKPRPGRAAARDEAGLLSLLTALGIECRNAGYPSPYALCCGAAGGMPQTQPVLAARMAMARLPETGVVVTVDPRCAAHMREAAAATAVEVYGCAEFIERHCDVARRAV